MIDPYFSLFQLSALTSFLLLSFFAITTCIQLTRRNRHLAFVKIIKAPTPPFIWTLAKSVAQANTFDILQFFLTGAQQCVRIATIVLATFFFISYWSVWSLTSYLPTTASSLIMFFVFSSLLSMLFIFVFDFLPRYVSAKYAEKIFGISFFLTSLCIILFFPFIAFALKAAQWLTGSKSLKLFSTPHEQLVDLIDELAEGGSITEADKRLLSSVFNFKERIAREIMKPRVNLFCLPCTISLKEAAICLQKEGYSRVPVFKNTIDSITGVLFYKDILSAYVSAKKTGNEPLLHESVEKYIKKIHYCPETKKISTLLQEFRKKQTHLAVVVDEYGGTSGLVTIEDILEEIVGEIADEYDDIEVYYQKIDDNHWIVDARANILDLEEETGIEISQEGEYDTVAGYIFFKLGAIPLVGHIVHHDEYDMKIIACNDRMVEKVEIILHEPLKEE